MKKFLLLSFILSTILFIIACPVKINKVEIDIHASKIPEKTPSPVQSTDPNKEINGNIL